MSDNHYQIYINKVLQLAETIVIKSAETAEALNNYVADYYGAELVDTLDRTSWKYYLNISGEYHNVDTPMVVVSMDTLENIIFSKENLAVHRATARNYAYGTRQYRELVAQYPKQEMLILGILYPVDINTAIAAKDGTILGYPPELVEENEYTFISKLQRWIDGYKVRWVNTQFGISDELYSATALGIMYLQLVPTILNIRLEACKTNEAHSFHVRQYLASHGLLDAYLESMTTKQALFFYRNIAYIERNVGKREIFEWLVEHIMTERYLPIGEYTMRHDLSNQPNDVYPTLMFKKKALNAGYGSNPTITATLDQLLNKQDPMARDNVLYKDDLKPAIQKTMENSTSNVVLTKVLESSVIDTSNSSPYSLEDILLNHWLWLSSQDIYTAFIGVTNPKTGERIPLTSKEAYTFLWYAYCKSIGIELTTIPQVYAKRVQRLPGPPATYASLSAAAVTPSPNPVAGSVDDLMSVVNNGLIARSIAEAALSMQPDITSIISTEAFYDLCKMIYNAAQMQRNLIASQEHAVKRGMVHGMVSRIYSDNICTLEPDGTTYDSWFAQRNIDAAALSADDMKILYQDLVREATGMALNSNSSLKDLQAAMVKMLSQLSSYSIQIIAQINNTEIKKTDWTVVRVGDVHSAGSQLVDTPDMVVGVQHQTTHMTQHDVIPLNGKGFEWAAKSRANSKASLAIKINPTWAPVSNVGFMRMPMARVNVKSHTPLQPNNQGIVPVIGIQEYLQLTPEQQQNCVDVYNNNYSSLPWADVDPDTTAADQQLYMTLRYTTPNYSF